MSKKEPLVKPGDFFLNHNDKLCIVTEISRGSVMYKLVCGAGSAFHYGQGPTPFYRNVVKMMVPETSLAPFIRKAKMKESRINLAGVDEMTAETNRIIQSAILRQSRSRDETWYERITTR